MKHTRYIWEGKTFPRTRALSRKYSHLLYNKEKYILETTAFFILQIFFNLYLT